MSSHDQQSKIYVTAATNAAPSSSTTAAVPLKQYHVRLQGRQPFVLPNQSRRRRHQQNERMLSWLSEYNVVRLRVSVNRLADNQYPLDAAATTPDDASSWRSGPSGVFIAARFRIDQSTAATKHKEEDANGRHQVFWKILQRLVGDRWVAAPLVSLQQRQHVDMRYWNESSASLAEYSTTVAFQGGPLSAEGLHMLLTKEQELAYSRKNEYVGDDDYYDDEDSADAPFLTTLQPNATIWSQLLLGRLAAAGNNKDRRGLWMEWTMPMAATSNSGDGNNYDTSTCSNQNGVCHQVEGDTRRGYWDFGLYYSIPKPADDHSHIVTLKDLIPLAMIDAGRSSDGNYCDLSNVGLMVAAAATATNNDGSSGHAFTGTSIQLNGLAPEEATTHFGACRDVLSETVVAAPTLVAPDPFWHVAMYIQKQPYSTGRVLARVDNFHKDCGASVTLQQTIPRVLKPVWQSLQVQLVPRQQHQVDMDATVTSCALNETISVPWTSLEHQSINWHDDGSFQLQLTHVIPSETSLLVSFEYEPLFLPFESFPADANRGRELPPLVAHLTTLNCPVHASATLYSHSVLFLPPLPDMSMPFNILSLTCTLYVFIIGSLINHAVRKSSERVKCMLYPERKPKSMLQQVKERVRNIMWRRLRKDKGVDSDDCKQSAAAAAPDDAAVAEHDKEQEKLDYQIQETPCSSIAAVADDGGPNGVDDDNPAKILLDQLLWKIPSS